MTAFPSNTHCDRESTLVPDESPATRNASHELLVRSAQNKRRCRRAGHCVLIAALALPSLAFAADTKPQETESKPGIESKLFRLPSFLNRVPLPTLSRLPDRTAAAEPKPSNRAESVIELPAPAESASSLEVSQRVLERARQLMSDARQLESRGHDEAALDLARRADAIFSTSQALTPVQWPAGEQRPNEYVASLVRKTAANTPDPSTTKPAVTAGSLLPLAAEPGATTQIDPAAVLARQVAELLPTAQTPAQLSTGQPPAQNLLPSLGNLEQNGQLLLDWGRRGIAVAETVKHVKQAVEEKRIDDLTQIALAGTAVVVEAVSNSSSAATVDETPVSEASDVSVRDLLRDQLKRLEGWQPGASPATEPLQTLENGQSTPLLLPQNRRLTADRDVGRASPTPTEATEPAPVVTIPAQQPFPTLDGVEPRLLNEPAGHPAVPAPPSNGLGQPASDPVWYVALVQMLSTFFGVALALVAFVLLRGFFKRDATPATTSEPATASQTAEAPVVIASASNSDGPDSDASDNSDESGDDDSHVVPFKRAASEETHTEETERRAA